MEAMVHRNRWFSQLETSISKGFSKLQASPFVQAIIPRRVHVRKTGKDRPWPARRGNDVASDSPVDQCLDQCWMICLDQCWMICLDQCWMINDLEWSGIATHPTGLKMLVTCGDHGPFHSKPQLLLAKHRDIEPWQKSPGWSWLVIVKG
jgi:hypothetical protein